MKTTEFANIMKQIENGETNIENAMEPQPQPQPQQEPRKELTNDEITDTLHYLAETYKTTSAIKAAKDEICKALNISSPCYVQVLKAWKITRINAAKDDNKKDKEVLRSFENTLKIVVNDMLQNEKYSKNLRALLNKYEGNTIGIFERFCRNYNSGQFLTIKSRYNFTKGIIIKRYEVDDNLTSAKVFSLLAGVLDEIKRSRINIAIGKELFIYKYVQGEVYAAAKFEQPYDGQNRPKMGELITDENTIKLALEGSVLWSERE